MTKLKHETILKGIQRLEDVCSNFTITESTDETWLLALSDLSDEQVQLGFVLIVKNMTSDYNRKPMPGDIRKLIAEQTPETNWSEVWVEILEKYPKMDSPTISGWGKVPVPQWSSPEVEQAFKEMGGLDYFKYMSANVETPRAQFRGIYENVVKRFKLLNSPALGESTDDIKKLESGKE